MFTKPGPASLSEQAGSFRITQAFWGCGNSAKFTCLPEHGPVEGVIWVFGCLIGGNNIEGQGRHPGRQQVHLMYAYGAFSGQLQHTNAFVTG